MGSVEDVIERMKLLAGAIPARPSAAEVEQARLAIREEDRSLTSKLGELYQEKCPSAVPEAVFGALQELHESVLRTQSDARKKDVLFVLHLEERHRLFDELLQKVELERTATGLVASANSEDQNHVGNASVADGKLSRSLSGPQPGVTKMSRAPDSTAISGAPDVVDSKLEEREGDSHNLATRTHEEGRLLFANQQQPRSPIPASSRGGYESPQTSYVEIKPSLTTEQEGVLETRWPANLLDILETAENGGTQPETLNFSNGGYNWMPDSIGILDKLTTLNLSGNQLTTVPGTIGALTALVELDLESNHLKSLPDSIGDLTCLKKLNLEKNSIEEIPYTIGGCRSLVELRVDFNQLKALPEAIGQLKDLQFLSVHLNSLKSLPTTLSSLSSLTDLFVNFNHLDTLPESLCSLTGLTRLDASSNFAEFRHLPNQIGNLQGLRDLDLSFNHIVSLPDSFTSLTNLRSLKLEGNPWRLPPLETVAEGKEAIFKFLETWREREEEAKKKSANKSIVSRVFSCCGNPDTVHDSKLYENKFARVRV